MEAYVGPAFVAVGVAAAIVAAAAARGIDAVERRLTHAWGLEGRSVDRADHLGMREVREVPGEVHERPREEARPAGNSVVVKRLVAGEVAQNRIAIVDDLKEKRAGMFSSRTDPKDCAPQEVKGVGEAHHFDVAQEALSVAKAVRGAWEEEVVACLGRSRETEIGLQVELRALVAEAE